MFSDSVDVERAALAASACDVKDMRPSVAAALARVDLPGPLRKLLSKSESTRDSATTSKSRCAHRQNTGSLDDEQRQLSYRYAADRMSGDQFIAASRILDEKLGRLILEKSKLAAVLCSAFQVCFLWLRTLREETLRLARQEVDARELDLTTVVGKSERVRSTSSAA